MACSERLLALGARGNIDDEDDHIITTIMKWPTIAVSSQNGHVCTVYCVLDLSSASPIAVGRPASGV